MSEKTPNKQVNIEELEKAVSHLGRCYKGDDFSNFLYSEFPDFTFTKIGEDWKITQDLRIVTPEEALKKPLYLHEVENMLLFISKTFDLNDCSWFFKEDEDGDNMLAEFELIEAWQKRDQ